MAETNVFKEKSGEYPLYTIYREMERRFEERGQYIAPSTRERCYSLLLVMVRKNRPLKPYEIEDELLLDPNFAVLQDPKRTIFYNLELLKETGIVEAVVQGSTTRYRLAQELSPRIYLSAPMELREVTDPRVKPLISSWNRVAFLRDIAKQWKIPSVAFSLVYELSSLLHYIDSLFFECNEESRRRLSSIEEYIDRLTDVYTAYASSGEMPEGEAELFLKCREKILKFCRGNVVSFPEKQ